MARPQCQFCCGSRVVDTPYTRLVDAMGTCPRCRGTGIEPDQPGIHVGLLLRNTSGKIWAVYSDYAGDQATPPTTGRAWGIHRMIPDRVAATRYVWQIRVFPESLLLGPRWSPVGFGDAWDHSQMRPRPLTGCAPPPGP